MDNCSLYIIILIEKTLLTGVVFVRVRGQFALLYGIKEIRHYGGNNIYVI